VYRYFPTTEALLGAVAFDSSRPVIARLERIMAAADDPVDAIVEGMAYAIEQLPRDPYISVMLTSGRVGAFARGVTGSGARAIGRFMLDPLVTNWTDLGAEPDEIDDLIEWTLRVLQSLLLDPGTPPRTRAQTRAYLYRWFAPALRSA
jgi:AcrR family transcriptional regulator